MKADPTTEADVVNVINQLLGAYKERDIDKLSFPLRLTAILEQRNGDWLLTQSPISVPAGGQEEGSSVPA